MPATFLVESRHKLSRAYEHLKRLDEEIAAFLESKPYFLLREYDAKQPQYRIRIKHRRPLPIPYWALIIGDCVHNARTALDYIAWQLAGADLADRNSMWPIFETQAAFRVRGLDRLRNVHHEAVAEIAKLQPYNRPNPQMDFFWILQNLDARDKHKLLTLTYMFNDSGTIETVLPPGMIPTHGAFSSDGRADDNAVVATIPLNIPVGAPDPQMQVNTELTFDIAFERGIIAPDQIFPVRDSLKAILRAVDSVIERFDGLIAAHPYWV